MNIAGIDTLLFLMEFFMFLWENTFIAPLLMMLLHCIIDDVIVMS